MSSFQSFKSFVKIQPNNKPELTPYLLGEKKPNPEPFIINDLLLKNNNESQSESNQLKGVKKIKKVGSICNFILKVYSMLEQEDISHIVSWSEKDTSLSSKNLGSEYKNQLRPQTNVNSFQILNLQKFEQIVLPKYFKHSNMSSFVRQLNMYGFHKLRGEKGNYQFQHQKFCRNNKQLLSEIRRKNPEFGGLSSSHLEDNAQVSLRNLKSIQDKVSYFPEQKTVTQQELFSLNEDFHAHNYIFPSEGFLPRNKLSFQVQQERDDEINKEDHKNKKIRFIEEENNRLKKIKLTKMERIHQLNEMDDSQIEIKFSKVIFSLIASKLKQDLKNKQNKQGQIQDFQKKSNINLNLLTDHILSNQRAKSFQFYTKNINSLLQKDNLHKESSN